MEERIAVKLAELEQTIYSNTRRIESLEQAQEALNRLATAVSVLASKQDGLTEDVKAVGEKIDRLEKRPIRRWETIFDRLMVGVLSMLLGYLLTQAGIAA